ncbi:hypothetical protein SNEBB_011322 [Seison nebaliae]|nr:hypothetical protein SNEBB_011322 [Seison nebaliae]
MSILSTLRRPTLVSHLAKRTFSLSRRQYVRDIAKTIARKPKTHSGYGIQKFFTPSYYASNYSVLPIMLIGPWPLVLWFFWFPYFGYTTLDTIWARSRWNDPIDGPFNHLTAAHQRGKFMPSRTDAYRSARPQEIITLNREINSFYEQLPCLPLPCSGCSTEEERQTCLENLNPKYQLTNENPYHKYKCCKSNVDRVRWYPKLLWPKIKHYLSEIFGEETIKNYVTVTGVNEFDWNERQYGDWLYHDNLPNGIIERPLYKFPEEEECQFLTEPPKVYASITLPSEGKIQENEVEVSGETFYSTLSRILFGNGKKTVVSEINEEENVEEMFSEKKPSERRPLSSGKHSSQKLSEEKGKWSERQFTEKKNIIQSFQEAAIDKLREMSPAIASRFSGEPSVTPSFAPKGKEDKLNCGCVDDDELPEEIRNFLDGKDE